MRNLSIFIVVAMLAPAQVRIGGPGGSSGILLRQKLSTCSTPAVLGNSSCATNPSTTSVSGSFASLPNIGDTVVVFCGGGASNTFSFSDNQSNSYSPVTAANGTSANGTLYVATTKVTASSGTFTVTCTGTTTDFLAMSALEYAHLSATALDLGSTTTGGSTTTMTPGPITTTVAREVVVSGCVDNASGPTVVMTPQNSFVLEASQTNGDVYELLSVQDQIETATGTYTGSSITTSTTTGGTFKCGVIGLK